MRAIQEACELAVVDACIIIEVVVEQFTHIAAQFTSAAAGALEFAVRLVQALRGERIRRFRLVPV